MLNGKNLLVSIFLAITMLIVVYNTSTFVAYYLLIAMQLLFLLFLSNAKVIMTSLPVFIILGILPPLSIKFEMEVIEILQSLQTTLTTISLNTFSGNTFVSSGYHILSVNSSGGQSIYHYVATVAPECSGYQSLSGIIILMLGYASHPSVTVKRKILIIICAPVLSVFGNFARVFISTYLISCDYNEWAKGLPHSILGLAIFCGQMLLLGKIAGFKFQDLKV